MDNQTLKYGVKYREYFFSFTIDEDCGDVKKTKKTMGMDNGNSVNWIQHITVNKLLPLSPFILYGSAEQLGLHTNNTP